MADHYDHSEWAYQACKASEAQALEEGTEAGYFHAQGFSATAEWCKGLPAQLKERDAIIDEAMRRAKHEGYCAVHEPIAGVEEDCNCGLAALRARIEEARR